MNAVQVMLKPFEPADQDAVRSLILDGMRHHWGSMDEKLNPDLNDIASAYAGQIFLVAWFNGQIVGTGAFIRRTSKIAQIVRMSVAREWQRRTIGNQILSALCSIAYKQGYQHMILETTSSWLDVINFYERFGFQKTHYQGSDIYFRLDLQEFSDFASLHLIEKT
jgi:GNAT superfamily N-acetyltransferase